MAAARTASPILIAWSLAGRVRTLATHAGIASTARCSRARYALGVIPTISVNRELNEPREVQPTSIHASVTLNARAQQRHRPLNPPGHEVAVRRLAVGRPKRPGEVPRRHQRVASHCRHVERTRILPVDQIPRPAQVRKVGKVLLVHGTRLPGAYQWAYLWPSFRLVVRSLPLRYEAREFVHGVRHLGCSGEFPFSRRVGAEGHSAVGLFPAGPAGDDVGGVRPVFRLFEDDDVPSVDDA